jgi:hypothetical protein
VPFIFDFKTLNAHTLLLSLSAVPSFGLKNL